MGIIPYHADHRFALGNFEMHTVVSPPTCKWPGTYRCCGSVCPNKNWVERKEELFRLRLKNCRKLLFFFFFYNCLGYLDRGLDGESCVKLYPAFILFHSEEVIGNSTTAYSPLATVLSSQAASRCQHYLCLQNLQTSLSFSPLMKQVPNLVAVTCATCFPVGSQAWEWNLSGRCHMETLQSNPTHSIATWERLCTLSPRSFSRAKLGMETPKFLQSPKISHLVNSPLLSKPCLLSVLFSSFTQIRKYSLFTRTSPIISLMRRKGW